MNKLFSTPLFALLAVCVLFPLAVSAYDREDEYLVQIQKKRPVRDDDSGSYGKRIPARPINCVISRSDGVTIGGSHEYFESYEIWDTTGETCLSISYEESSFLDDFFSLPAPFTIILNSSDYSFIGTINSN